MYGVIWTYWHEETKHIIQDQKALPVILPNQIYCTKRGMAVKLPSGEYWYYKAVKKHGERKEQF